MENQNQEILNKVITIASKEEAKIKNNNTQVRIIDQDNMRFAFFKKKKDGTLSSPAAQFRDMGLDEGSTVKIGYVVEEYKDARDFTRTSNKIINFQETNETPAAGQITPQTDTPQPSRPERPLEVTITRQVAFKGAIELAKEGTIALTEIHNQTNMLERILRGLPPMTLPNEISKPEALPIIDINEDDGLDKMVEGIPF